MEGFNQDQRQLCQSDCLNRGVHPILVRPKCANLGFRLLTRTSLSTESPLLDLSRSRLGEEKAEPPIPYRPTPAF